MHGTVCNLFDSETILRHARTGTFVAFGPVLLGS